MNRLGSLASRLGTLIRAGTGEYPPSEQRGLVVANVTGMLASLSSLCFAVTYALHDPAMFKPLIVGNLVSAACTASTPLWHRLGRVAAALWLTSVFFISLTYFTSLLGRDSGVILNLLGAAAIAFAVLGRRRLGLVTAITLAAAALILYCWRTYATPAPNIQLDPVMAGQLFATSIISIMAIIYLVIYHSLLLSDLAAARADALLRSIMPAEIVDRLQRDPSARIAQRHEVAAVMMADIVGFTELSAQLGPERIVELLDELFRGYDAIAAEHGVEKIKTIGDAYMAVCGVPMPHRAPELALIRAAVEIMQRTRQVGQTHRLGLTLRIGLASGAVTAGVIGSSKYFYDVWGPPVNLAARLQTAAAAGEVLVSESLWQAGCRTDDPRHCLPEAVNPAETLELKGIGPIGCRRLRPGE